MSDAEYHRAADDDPGGAHGSGHGDEPGEPLGPIDLRAWAYTLVGGLAGVVTVLALYAAAA